MTHDIPKPKPKPIGNRLRFEIMRRDGHRCRYCGLQADKTGKGLTVDHVRPVALGGTNDPTNLVTACKDCNSGKASTSPDEHHVAQVSEDAVRWAAAMREAHAQASADLRSYDLDLKAFSREWRAADLAKLEPGWQDSVRRFLGDGITRADLLHFVPVVANRRVPPHSHFRYFCGCILNEMEKRYQKAQEIVSPPADPEPSHEWYFLGCDLRERSVGPEIVGLIAGTARRGIDEAAAEQIEGGYHDWLTQLDVDLGAEVQSFLESFAGFGRPVLD